MLLWYPTYFSRRDYLCFYDSLTYVSMTAYLYFYDSLTTFL